MSNAANEPLATGQSQRRGAPALLLLLAFAALITALVGCAATDPVIKVGLVAPFEGRSRAVGYDAIYSARLAVREINAAGGIGGYRVTLVALDDSGDPELAQQAAASLVVDPGVVAVAGHWLPQTSAVAADVYAQGKLPLLVLGQPPFEEQQTVELPQEFRRAYEAVTPFDETPGRYAAASYDAFQLLWLALAEAQRATGSIDRMSVAAALSAVEHDGLSGNVFWRE